MEFGDIVVHFNILDAMKHPSKDHSVFRAEIIDQICRNLPFYGRARLGSRVRLPKEENVRSCHQRLFVENIRKTKGNRS